MSLLLTEFRPRSTVRVKTWGDSTRNAQEFDLTGELMSWNTTKSLTQPQGTFAIELTAATHNGKSWDEILRPMDYVEIRASATGTLQANGEYPVIMRGFVDSVMKSTSFGGSGGPSEPRVFIQGRDYAKLLLEWQILYLWTQNDFAKQAANSLGLGLITNYHVPDKAVPLNTLFKEFATHVLDPVVKGLNQTWFNSLDNFLYNFNLPDYESSPFSVMSYTGSYWNLLSYYVSAPFGELFVTDTELGPELTARMTPYKAYDGSVPSPGHDLPDTLTLSTDLMQSTQVGVSDNDVFTYFLTWGSMTQLTKLTMPAFVAYPGNGTLLNDGSLYGTRPLIVDSAWLNPYSGTDTSKANDNAATIASEMNTWLTAVMKDNMKFKSGVFSMHGSEKYTIGQYTVVKEWDEEYYISGVSHSFVQFEEWQSELEVVRGRPLSSTNPTTPQQAANVYNAYHKGYMP